MLHLATYSLNSKHADQLTLLGFKDIHVDRVARVIPKAAFHDLEREILLRAMEAAETSAWGASCLHLSRSAYRVDDGIVIDAHIRTLIMARQTFQVCEQ